MHISGEKNIIEKKNFDQSSGNKKSQKWKAQDKQET